MRIAVMLRHYDQPGGGVKVYTNQLLRRLFEIDHANHYILLYQNPALVGTYAGLPNVEEIALPVANKLLWDQVAVPYAAWREHADLIFNLKFTVPLLTRRKTAFIIANSEWFAVPELFLPADRRYFQRMGPLYYRRADVIIAISETAKQDALKAVQVDPNKIIPVHLGYDNRLFRPITDPARLAEVRAKYHLPEHYMFWLGQVSPLKNINGLLRAFGQIKDQVPHQLVIGGSRQRWDTANQLQPIDALGLHDRVQFTGWVEDEDLPAIYSLADLFVFPSLYEGFGIPLLEAMACGCPVLTSNVSATAEVVGDAGYTVDPYCTESIADGMVKVLNDAPLRETMITRGLERVKAFSWEKTAREVVAVLERVGQPAAAKERAWLNRRPSFWLRLALSVIFIAFLLGSVDLNDVRGTLADAAPGYLLLAFGLALADRVFMAYKWRLLVKVKGIRLSVMDAVSIYLKTSFLGLMLPSTVGSDVLRAYSVGRWSARVPDVISSVLVERVLGFLALFVFVVVAIAMSIFVFDQTFFDQIGGLLGIFIVLLIGLSATIYVSLNKRLLAWMERQVRARNIDLDRYRFVSKLKDVYRSYESYRHEKTALSAFFFLSLVENVMSILVMYSLALAFHIDVSLTTFFILVPITLVLIRLPISINGIGIQEGVFVYFLRYVGVAQSRALLLGASGNVIALLAILVGGVLYAMSGLNLGDAPVTVS